MFEVNDIGKKKITEELCPLFKKLQTVKDQLGYETWEEIRMRLVVGHTDAQTRRYFMGEKRKMVNDYLGGKNTLKIIKDQLGL